jgi:hypothetical protein
MEDEQNTPQLPDNMWKISLAILCVGILAYSLLYSENTIDNLPYLIGYFIPWALLIWAVFIVVIGKTRRLKVAGLSFLAIYGSLIVSALIGLSQQKIGLSQQKQEAVQAITEIQDQYAALIRSSVDSQSIPKSIERRIDTTPKAQGELGEVERFMKEFINQMASQRNKYLLEFTAIGWDRILDPRRIENDKTLAESKMTIEKAKAIVEKYDQETNVLLGNARQRIQTLDVSAASKQEMTSSFDRGMEKAKQEIYALWALEKKTVCEFENIFNLLFETRGTWVVSEGQILFHNDDDLNKFNSYIASIQSLVNQQEEIQRRCIETVNRNFDSLKQMK